jgi:hypothetical protein
MVIETEPFINPLDLIDAEKRMKRLLGTPEGREAFRRVTGATDARFACEAEVQRDKLPIVAVLVPSYRVIARQTQDALKLMFDQSASVCQLYIQPSVSSSVVHWSRNTALAMLLKTQKPFDYVLFVDDDMGPPPDALIKLLSHKADIVAAACTLRTDPPTPNFREFRRDSKTFHTCFDWTRDGLLKGEYGAGTGMVLISHDCLKRVAEYHINCEFEKKYFGLSGETLNVIQTGRQEKAKTTADFWWYEFLKHPYGQGEFGEDISFCFKCIEMGIPVCVDTSIKPKHWGDYGYSIEDYFDYQEACLEAQRVRHAGEALKAQEPIEVY